MNPCRLGLIPHSLHVCGTLLVPHTRLQMSCPSPSPGSEVRLAACSPRALQRTLVTGWASHRLMRHRGGTGSLSLPLPVAVAFPPRPAKAGRAREARGVWGSCPGSVTGRAGGACWGHLRAMRPQAPPPALRPRPSAPAHLHTRRAPRQRGASRLGSTPLPAPCRAPRAGGTGRGRAGSGAGAARSEWESP